MRITRFLCYFSFKKSVAISPLVIRDDSGNDQPERQEHDDQKRLRQPQCPVRNRRDADVVDCTVHVKPGNHDDD